MPASKKRDEHEKVKQELGLCVAGLEDKDAERDDASEVGGGKRGQLTEKKDAERKQQQQRQINIRALRDLEECGVGQIGTIEEREVAGVQRHPVALADHRRRPPTMPVRVDVFRIPQIAALIAARLRGIDPPSVF